MADLAAAPAVTPSTAGRMCDILVRKGLMRLQQAGAGRRATQVSITAIGLQVASEATARRRKLIAGILGKLRPTAASDRRCGAGIPPGRWAGARQPVARRFRRPPAGGAR